MAKVIGVYGASGFGREVLPLVREQYADAKLCFVDDGSPDTQLSGYSVCTFEEFLALPQTKKAVVFAIANSRVREILEAKCREANLEIISVKASNSIVLDQVEIGDGAVK